MGDPRELDADRTPPGRARVTVFLIVVGGLWLALWGSSADGWVVAAEPRHTENVIVVTWDGFRRQELFTGAELALVDPHWGGVRSVADLKQRYWRDSPEERRAVLLPFFWRTLATQGQIFGDPSREAPATSTNGLKFSYPGYSEMFCGFADERITSNDKKINPNPSVFEFLHGRPGFAGRVAAFCTWDVFPYILRSETNGIPVHAGWRPVKDEPLSQRQRFANELIEQLPRVWPDSAFDWMTMEATREHLQRNKPRVLLVGLGETDEWAHSRRYDLYLDAAHRADRFLEELWTTLQTLPEYKDKTTLIVTTDHGRGSERENWTDHGQKVPFAEFIWMAVLGPDTPALGLRSNVAASQAQIAATVAGVVGEDFRALAPRARPPLPGVGAAFEVRE